MEVSDCWTKVQKQEDVYCYQNIPIKVIMSLTTILMGQKVSIMIGFKITQLSRSATSTNCREQSKYPQQSEEQVYSIWRENKKKDAGDKNTNYHIARQEIRMSMDV